MKLCGIAVSNYYNIVKLALLEKQIEFEEVVAPPSQEPEFLAHSPMGKIPYIQHGTLSLSESQAILFYLELLQPCPRLYPTEPAHGARAQQIHQFIDLYIDSAARKLLPAAFFGAPVDDATIEQVGSNLKQRVQALSQIAEFAPYIGGENLTHADLAAFMTFHFAQSVMARLSDIDPLARLSGVGAYLDLMAQRDSCQQVLTDQQAALAQLS